MEFNSYFVAGERTREVPDLLAVTHLVAGQLWLFLRECSTIFRTSGVEASVIFSFCPELSPSLQSSSIPYLIITNAHTLNEGPLRLFHEKSEDSTKRKRYGLLLTHHLSQVRDTGVEHTQEIKTR